MPPQTFNAELPFSGPFAMSRQTASTQRENAASDRQPLRRRSRIFLLVFFLTALPIANIVSVVFTTGADNPSNDYLQYMGLIDHILNGNYNWWNYIGDTFYRTHSVALPVLLHVLNAWLFGFSMYVELAIGIVLAVLRLVLLAAVFLRPLTGWRKLALIPLLSCLIFSDSQMSVFSYGDAALTIQLSLLGFALGLWGLFCASNDRVRGTCIVLGGIIASYSWGNGPVTWIVFLAGLLLMYRQRLWLLVAWLAGFAVSLFPYVQALIVPAVHGVAGRNGTTLVSPWNSRFMLNLIGWPFVNNIGTNVDGSPMSKAIGWTALGFCAVTLAALAKLRRPGWWQAALPAILCMLHGFLSVWQISLFRPLLASWYTTVAMSVWIGLLALMFVVVEDLVTHHNEWKARKVSLLLAACCSAFFAFLAVVYAQSNLTYDDKTNLLYSRSPASAAAIRHYADAPASASNYVFQWGGDKTGLLPLLAAPLERHHLSVFGPHQTWTLQGDSCLPSVTYLDNGRPTSATWIEDRSTNKAVPWWSYQHLNLVLAPSHTVRWTVSIPANVRGAELQTAAAALQWNPNAKHRALAAILTIDPDTKSEFAVMRNSTIINNEKWHPITLPLTQYAGHTVVIEFSAFEQNDQAVIWQYPLIKVDLL